VEKDLGQAAAVVLAGMAFLVACAPAVVSLLFERGAFSPADTAATAQVIQVYSFGLLAQALIGVMVRPFFSMRPAVRRADDPRPEEAADRLLDWYPVGAMAVGLVVTTLVGLGTTQRFGALGLAAGNAAGITTTAALLLRGLALRGIALRTRQVLLGQGRLALAAAGAATVGTFAARAVTPAPLSVLAGGTVVLACYLAIGAGLGARELTGPVSKAVALVRGRRGRDGAGAAPSLEEGTLTDGR
jgi:putative peptidoglycan lipid II flippase